MSASTVNQTKDARRTGREGRARREDHGDHLANASGGIEQAERGELQVRRVGGFHAAQLRRTMGCCA